MLFGIVVKKRVSVFVLVGVVIGVIILLFLLIIGVWGIVLLLPAGLNIVLNVLIVGGVSLGKHNKAKKRRIRMENKRRCPVCGAVIYNTHSKHR